MNKFFTKHSHWLLVIGIVISFIVLSVGSAQRESLTYDEIVHAEEGLNHLQHQTFTIDPYNPPLVRELQMLPIAMGASKDKLFPARLVTIFLGALLVVSVYAVTRRYFGNAVALVALFLLAFDPNVLAHSHYVTLDVGTALFFFLAYGALLWFWEGATRVRSVVFGMSLGFALASRVIVIGYIVVSAILLGLTGQRKLPSLKYIGTAILISLFVVWATYFFRWEVVIAKGGSMGRVSERLKTFAISRNLTVLQSGLGFFGDRPLPLGNYLATVKNSFLRGTQKGGKPPWYELAVNVFLKTPVPLLLLTALALLRVKKGKKETKQLIIFAMPILAILTVSSLGGMEPRVRYVLSVYPFFAVLAAIGIREVKGTYGKLGVGVLLLWYVVETLLQFPHFISYANELAGPREKRYQLFTDSNIDWGQSLPDMKTYIDKKKPDHVSFSYFGRDNGNDYGLVSNRAWGSYKFEDICGFHEIVLPYEDERIVAISISNWHGCGYSQQKEFAKENIRDIVGDSILLFIP